MKILPLLSLCSSIFGASYTWTGTTNSDWNTSTNWTPSGVPNAIDDGAIFPTTFTNQPNVGVSTVVGSIQLSSTPTATTISGAGGLNFSVSSGSATLTALTTGHTLSTNLTLSSNLVTNIAQNSIVTISGNVSGAGSLTVGGGGTTALTGTNNFSGGVFVSSGILQVNADSALGALANTVTLAGTFQASGSITSARSFILETATFDTNSHPITLSGVVSGHSLTKIGAGTLSVSGNNTYTGGTAVQVGTLSILSDQNLGATSAPLSLANNTTLLAGSSYTLGAARPVSVTGAVTIDTASFSPTIASNIAGTGSLQIIGTQLTLSGTNSYSGATTVNTATLIGNTTSLQGTIHGINGSTMIFNQSNAGTYEGVYDGNAGTTLQLQGGGTYTFTGNSSASLSTTHLVNSKLILNGSLGSSSFNIDALSNLSGTGTVITSSGMTNAGKITPGNSPGTLIVNGNVTFTSNSGTLVSQIEPTTNSLLQVGGTANLNHGILSLEFTPGAFYPLTNTYTLLTAGSRIGTFDTILQSASQFALTIIYTPTTAQLSLTNLQPFFSFDFGNANERAVGHNLDALSADSLLSADLIFVINSLAGKSTAEVNRALDQLHPAAISALAELQTALGGQLLNRLHQKAGFTCGCLCDATSLFWIEPFGNWLQEKKQDMQIGFHATTRGISIGFDQQFFDCWTCGLAGIYQMSDLCWARHRGYSYIRSAYGAFYSDVNVGNFYLGSSAFAGKDWNHIVRQIRFTSIDRQAKSHSTAFDAGGQLNTAYFFGSRSFQLFPYGTVDFLYLENEPFSEKGAASLNLDVQEYRSSTLRAESGLAFRFVDRNYDETFCLTPLFSMGYVLELPLHRDHFRARFDGMPIAFRTKGWDRAKQLLHLQFGLTMTYQCFSLDSQYIADVSTEGSQTYMNQRANFRAGLQF